MLNPPEPPKELTDRLEVDSDAWSPEQIYYLQASLIVPRPIAWVSTVSASGTRNLAPHSYFNGVADDPPHIMFSIEGETDTIRNLREVPEFVVNMVTADLAEQMELTATHFPPHHSEFEWAQLTPRSSHAVRPATVAESKASLECRVVDVRPVGNKPNFMVLGEVLHFSVSHEIWHNGRVSLDAYRPIGRLGGRYAELGTIFRINRPRWEEVEPLGPSGALSLAKKQP